MPARYIDGQPGFRARRIEPEAQAALTAATSLVSVAEEHHRLPVVEDLVEQRPPGPSDAYVFLLAGILLAVFLDSVLGSRAPRRIALGGVTALIALAPLFPQLSFPSTSYPLPAFFTSSAAQRIPEGTVALIAPFSYFGENRAMLWQAYSGMRFRIPEAYAIIPGPSFNPPPSELGTAMIQIQLGVDPPTVSDGAIRQMREDLRRWKGRHGDRRPNGARGPDARSLYRPPRPQPGGSRRRLRLVERRTRMERTPCCRGLRLAALR